MNKQIFIKFLNNTDVSEIGDVSINNLKTLIKKKYGINSFFIIHNNKILRNVDKIKNNDEIEIHLKLKGGFISDLIKMLTGMMKLFKSLGKLVDDIINLLVTLVEAIPEIFSPDKLINGIIFGTLEGIKGLFTGTIGQLGGGSPRREKPKKKKKGYCFKATLFKLIILVLCPPLAIFVDRGLKGVIPIIISGALTYYLYYFPGLIFASLYLM